MHEAQMHENNIFLTLTYSDSELTTSALDYKHWQLFLKRLREKRTRGVKDKLLLRQLKIPSMVTGEYGEKTKRPHWHALLFNYWPKDAKPFRKTETGHQVYKSKEIEDLWGKGFIEFGEVTLDSANYVARYAAKKLVHGQDQDHQYHPIHRTSSRYGIGRSFIEKHWKDVFNYGYVVLPNGQKASIPRYYIDWLEKNKPEEYKEFICTVRLKQQAEMEIKARKEELDYLSEIMTHRKGRHGYPKTRSQVKHTILQSKFKNLQEKLKL